MDEGWRTFDHTGDLGLEVWAPSRERLFAAAAMAVLAQVAEGSGGAPECRVRIEVTAQDTPALIADFCNRALLEAEVGHALWTRVDVERLEDTSIAAVLSGPRRDPRRQVFLREIKAVAYHGLEAGPAEGGWRCRMILDV